MAQRIGENMKTGRTEGETVIGGAINFFEILLKGGKISEAHAVELSQTVADFRETCRMLDGLHTSKELGYKNSWCKRGLRGIFYTIARKWDRLETYNDNDLPIDKTYVDTIADLAVYSVKVLGWLTRTYPQQYAQWEREFIKRVEGQEDVLEFHFPKEFSPEE